MALPIIKVRWKLLLGAKGVVKSLAWCLVAPSKAPATSSTCTVDFIQGVCTDTQANRLSIFKQLGWPTDGGNCAKPNAWTTASTSFSESLIRVLTLVARVSQRLACPNLGGTATVGAFAYVVQPSLL